MWLKTEDLTGRRYNMFTVIGFSHYDEDGHQWWNLLCDCGNKRVLKKHAFVQKNQTTSCGCNHKKIVTTHGLSKTRIYRVYDAMISRCYRSNNQAYSYYGGRGITVCEEWRNDNKVFFDWAFKNGYRDDLLIDRIDCNGNYCPENCRFVTVIESIRNRRPYKKREKKRFNQENGIDY